MNVLRSPTGSDTNIERSDSQPNLSEMPSATVSASSTITFRNKRKHFDEDNAQIQCQLSDLQKNMAEMMSLLTSSISAQKESANEIKNEMAKISCEIQEVKDSVRSSEQQIKDLATNQNYIQDEIQNLKNVTQNAGDKIVSLETDLEEIKLRCDKSSKSSYDEILAELTEQNIRRKNVIVIGIPEPHSTDTKERAAIDKNKVLEALKIYSKDCPEPAKNIRVGRYKPGINRPIKVSFESEEIVKHILRSKGDTKNNEIKIFADQTPFQQNQLKQLKEELKIRIEKGEENLRIKYIKNVPKIVKNWPKKSKTQQQSTIS